MAFDAAITEKSADMIVLEKARERIARGWCQYKLQDEHGNVCMLGAFWKFPDTEAADPYKLLGWDLRAEPMIASWNNAPGRTQDEVLAVFDDAIAKLAAAQ